MCKVLIIPSIKDTKRAMTNRFIKLMAEKMSTANDDGLGYAAVTNTGELFAERWFNNKEMFTYSGTVSPPTSLYDKFGVAVKDAKPVTKTVDIPYSRFGNESLKLNNAAAITLHARFATCEKSLTNVHPFIKNDTSVIHNGVIRNHEKFNLEQSTCDSEAILLGYLKNAIGSNTSEVQTMASEFVGYYVAAMFSRDASGARILDVFNGNNTNLYLAAIKELETYVMATSDYDIQSVCRELGLTITECYQMLDDQFLRINPFTGDVVEHTTFRSGASYVTSPTVYPEANYNNWTEYNANRARTQNYSKSTVTHINNKSKSKPISDSEIKFLTKIPRIEVLSAEEGQRVLTLLNVIGA